MLTLTTFIDRYAEINEMPKTKARAEIERFINTFKDCTIADGGVNILGFMKSEVVTNPAKTVKNPKTQEDVEIPARDVVKLKISRKFKYIDGED